MILSNSVLRGIKEDNFDSTWMRDGMARGEGGGLPAGKSLRTILP